MRKLTRLIGSILFILHGLIHMMGTATYLRLAEIEGLAYKTTLLAGRWEVGQGGMVVFGFLWAIAGLGFTAAGVIWLSGKSFPRVLIMGIASLSLLLTLLDVESAYAGAAISGILLVLALAAPWFRTIFRQPSAQ